MKAIVNLLLITLFHITALPAWDGNCASKAQIIVMRHGESTHNVKNIINSNPNHPKYQQSDLTEKGRQQVEATANELLGKGFYKTNIVAVYVSPLPRTLQTAEILSNRDLFPKCLITIDPRLIEIQLGDMEGLPMGDPVWPWNEEFRLKHHAETDQQLATRIQDFYENILNKHSCGNVVVVTHADPAKKLEELILQRSLELQSTGKAMILPLSYAPARKY